MSLEKSDHFAPEGLEEFGAVGRMDGGEGEVEAGHFVGGLRTPTDTARRAGGVVGIAGRVVVGEVHFKARAGGKGERLAVAIAFLPVEVPIVDAEDFAAASGGEYGAGAETAREIVGVRDDAIDGDVDRQREVIANPVARCAGRDVDLAGAKREIEQGAGGRRRGEVEADARAIGLGLAGGVVVDLEHEVAARGPASGGAG